MMMTRESITEMVALLKNDPNVVGLIEFGSGGERDEIGQSDYDLFVVWDEEQGGVSSLHFYVDGRPVDLNLITVEELATIDAGGGFRFVALMDGRVIYDADGRVGPALRRVKEEGEKGLPSLSADEVARMRHWHRHVLDKVQGRLETEPIFCHFMMGTAVYWVVRNYFLCRGLVYKGEKAAVAYLEAEEPVLWEQVGAFYAEPDLEAKLEVIRGLSEAVLAPVGGMWAKGEVLAFGDEESARFQAEGQALFERLLGRHGPDREPTPFADLNEVLQVLLEGVQEILGDNFVGAYLQGSFAVGGFDRHSDVDFIVVTEGELTEFEVELLQAMHGDVYELESEWAKHLEGSYFPRAVLRDGERAGERLWYLDHGSRELIRSEHCNTLLVRAVVRQKGVTLAGPPPATLVEPVPVAQLRAEMKGVILGWGEEILAEPERYNNRFYQGFIVLNFCRMLHDLKRGRPGSKREGAAWAQANLDPRWRELIERAWATRPDPARSVRERADAEDFARTLEFVRYVMGEADEG